MIMRIISRATLKQFWQKHPDSTAALQAWYADVRYANWQSPADIKQAYRNASFVAHNRVVFNIKGNSYRIVVAIHYDSQIVFIRFVGTHQAYDKIDVTEI